MGAVHALRLVAAALKHTNGLLVFRLTRCGDGRFLVQHVAPFVAEIHHRGDVRLPRLDGKVIHVVVACFIGIILVSQTREAVPKFMDDDIAREMVAARAGTIEVVNAATAIFIRIDEDINLIVRYLACQVADVAVVGAHAVALRVEGPEAETHGRVLINMVARHGASRLLGRHHHAAHIETLTITVVRRKAEQALHKEVAILNELTHLGLRVAFWKYHNINGFCVVLVTNPSLVDGQTEIVVVVDEIVVGRHGEAHPFHQLAFPSLVQQRNINLHFRERHDDRLLKGLGESQGFGRGLPFAKEVLVALGKQQFICSRLKHLDDVVAKLKAVDEVGFGAAPIRLVNQLLEGVGSLCAVARQTIVHAKGRLGEITVKLRPSKGWEQRQQQKEISFHNNGFDAANI